MATTKTGVIKLSGLTITEKNPGTAVQIKGSGGNRLAITTSDDTDTVKLVSKKTATYILEDFKQLFTGNRNSVSLFGSAVTGFDATAYEKYDAVKIINATATAAEGLSLVGNDNANQIIAGAGGASLDGGAGNDTLTGGKGADTFIYSAGKDVIKNFTASNDSITIEEFTFTDASVSGSNVIMTFDKNNSLQIDGMAKKSLTFTDTEGTKTLNSGVLYSGESAIITGAFTTTSKITLGSTVTDIDASLAKKAVNIATGSSAGVEFVGSTKNDIFTGGAGADTIDGGKGNDKLYGGAGDDSILCGAGNDSLWGNDGEDEFVYASGDGKDVIFGFTSEDKLTLDDISFTSATVTNSGKQVALKLGTGSVTFKEFASGTTFAIGEETYQVVQSGKKYTFEQVEE